MLPLPGEWEVPNASVLFSSCLKLVSHRPRALRGGQQRRGAWDLQIQDLDTLVLNNGTSLLGTIDSIREDGSVVSECGIYRLHCLLPSQFRSFDYRRTAVNVLGQRMEFLARPGDPTRPLQYALYHAMGDGAA